MKGTSRLESKEKKLHNIVAFTCEKNNSLQKCLDFTTVWLHKEWRKWKKQPMEIAACFATNFRSAGPIHMGKLFEFTGSDEGIILYN